MQFQEYNPYGCNLVGRRKRGQVTTSVGCTSRKRMHLGISRGETKGRRKAENNTQEDPDDIFSFLVFFSYPISDYETKRKGVLVVLVPISLIASLCRSIGNWPISRQLPAIGSLNISHAFIFLFSFLSSLPTRPVPSFLSPRISCLSLFLYSYVFLYFIFYGFLSDREGVHLGASRWISHCRNPRS